MPPTPSSLPSVASLYTNTPLAQEPRPLIVGERTNANGSKRFRGLLAAGDFDGMVAIAREQAKGGSHLLDVCVAYVGRDEVADMREVVSRFATRVNLPLMFDSTEPAAIEAALQLYGGRAVINSINLEDGGERLHTIVKLARRYGAALVALTIDEQGMAKTVERKLAVARRIYDIVVNEYDFAPHDLLFDPLTFTLGSGDAEFFDAGKQTLLGIKALKQELPGVFTLLGLSNISFGLAPPLRKALNSVFLHYALEHGLDAAILNPLQIVPYYKVEEQVRELCRRLIFNEREDSDPLTDLLAHFAGQAETPQADTSTPTVELSLEERLQRIIVEGEKVGLSDLLDEALLKYAPLEIVNHHLLEGMQTVGRLFGSGDMQLPFVLQSAETMKAAVAHLEPHLAKEDSSTKGTLVIATVKGDVHDIGKNLVDIILTNNGYKVVNLGIKQPLEPILAAYREHEADALGLSGLLVKSTVVMKENLEELNRRGLSPLVLLGGAALTRTYVEQELHTLYQGQVYYGKDAFEALQIMEEQREAIPAAQPLPAPRIPPKVKEPVAPPASPTIPTPSVEPAPDIPQAPFYGSRIISRVPLTDFLPYINKLALFRGRWQFKRGSQSPAQYKAFFNETVEPILQRLIERAKHENFLESRVVYGYFPCYAEGNDLVILAENETTERLHFTFPRQPTGRRLCLTDYFTPQEKGPDVVAFQLVTVGSQVGALARELFQADHYRDYLYLHGFSVEAAEALAEYHHHLVRCELGLEPAGEPDIPSLLSARYQGRRYSFGFPACPELSDQAKLFKLLQPERIGVSLSETYQLTPEQSTSALIVHHPSATYFNVREQMADPAPLTYPAEPSPPTP